MELQTANRFADLTAAEFAELWKEGADPDIVLRSDGKWVPAVQRPDGEWVEDPDEPC